jgi:hypothetical protein
MTRFNRSAWEKEYAKLDRWFKVPLRVSVTAAYFGAPVLFLGLMFYTARMDGQVPIILMSVGGAAMGLLLVVCIAYSCVEILLTRNLTESEHEDYLPDHKKHKHMYRPMLGKFADHDFILPLQSPYADVSSHESVGSNNVREVFLDA